MKSFLILILTAIFSLADVNCMLVENIAAVLDKPAHVKISAYGLLENGQPKTFELTSSGDKAFSSNVENCKWGGPDGLNRAALRYWVFFNDAEVSDENGNIIQAKGEISKIDFHMSEKWEQKIIDQGFEDQMKLQIKKLKDFIEAK